MKRAKNAIGYGVAFTAGTLLSGSAVFAATNYVQAQKAKTSVQYHGTTISSPPGLVYGGSMYVQLYSIQQAMRKAGFVAGWNGSTFSLDENNTAKLSGGTADNVGTWIDVGYSVTKTLSDTLDFISAGEDANATPQSMTAVTDRLIGSLQDNVTALQKDTPSDANLVSIQKEYLNSLTELSTAFRDFKTAITTQSDADMQKFNLDFAQGDKDFQIALNDFGAYQPPGLGSDASTTGVGRFTHPHFPASSANNLFE